MNKRFLSAALAIGALLAGGQNSPLTQSAKVQALDDAVQSIEAAKNFTPKPAPAKSTSLTTTRRVEVVARPLAMMGAPVRFIERPGRRKVKYGKSRWIILG